MTYAHCVETAAARQIFERMALTRFEEMALDEAALLVAQEEYRELDPASVTRHLDGFADNARQRIDRETSPYGIANALSDYLFEEQRFRGNDEDYYSPRNSFLNDVIERRLGIPITLSLIYIEVARRIGVVVQGVGMPGHFIVRLESGEDRILIDPFRRGMILSDDDCVTLMVNSGAPADGFDPSSAAPASTPDIVYRMLNNLKQIYLSAHDYPRALAAVERLLLLQPQDAHQTRLRDRLREVVS